MKLHKDVFWGEAAGLQKAQILSGLRKEQVRMPLCLITLLPAGRRNQAQVFFIRDSSHLKLVDPEAPVIGVAADRGEAIQVLCRIVDQVYQETGNADLRAWFDRREARPGRTGLCWES